ncbi:hypothetical protein [Geminicoccus harenae]|uniref:hypothetical protein n=1 Tax=Geminicoccus harenae TaxID=2498453 RepID=UPI001C946CDD
MRMSRPLVADGEAPAGIAAAEAAGAAVAVATATHTHPAKAVHPTLKDYYLPPTNSVAAPRERQESKGGH